MLYSMITGDSPEDEFADYEFANGTQVHNSQAEDDGTFRRMITTPKGINVTFWNVMPVEIVGEVAAELDRVAAVNFEQGKRAKAGEIIRVLGLG
ncbi:hypothetical protein CcrKarma_gp238 [Caulobacter virus Karma]|uniref:Uncharacterized protein n=5 Tax=Viruses TaxID=10239 RepID=J3UI80_9CAUD|nr:hypothetical protein D865_gp192 [Caulobacter phage phiCbK]YP_006989618.1 hypothetical protein CcrKarma_gp238 [Caulobacter virus Karma]ARB14799.1 hypothetical protein Ccr29_gp243 [Caulobacter phage Ccr29]ARB15139.1 hypothetical protein Ccr32_gp221 [Caulobacter phage Ccr32]ARB15473.1 hypothetical protein Ccr34_gp231 [Caulobacter phage Ccr34]AFO71609.1 hypothetical protein phiCbK_095 [Caulobacter phage phiCbK]AFU87058.1 hypothetical protein CbK_gp226 [Caulobacter phage phiCbK]